VKHIISLILIAWILSSGVHQSTGGGLLDSFTDDFNRANSDNLGTSWTEPAVSGGDCDIFSNELELTAASAPDTAIWNTPTASITQFAYGKLTIITSSSSFGAGFVLRYTNASSKFYYVKFLNVASLVQVICVTSVGGTYDVVSQATLALFGGDTFGVTVQGTGLGGTTFRIWRNPSTTVPTSPTSWGGAGPDISLGLGTATSGQVVDTGNLIGITGTPSSALGLRWDNWHGGSM
jgi:hypothetical protein